MFAIGFAVAGLAYLLAYTGWQGGSVTAELSALFNGEPSPIMESARQRRETTAAALTTPASTSSTSGGGSTDLRNREVIDEADTVLVNTGTRTIRLSPAAAMGYHRWCESWGGLIPCTSGWRPLAQQQDAVAADPDRFGKTATGSAHVHGVAVDVDNNWLSALPAAQQTKLRIKAKAAGWRQARWMGEANCGSNTTNDDEPWHFSYKVCA